MFKKSLLTGFVVFVAATCFAQDTIYSRAYTSDQPFFDFEQSEFKKYILMSPSESINLWQWGTPSKTNFGNAFSGKKALITDTLNTYLKNNSSAFEFVVNTDDFTAISFWHKMDADSSKDGGLVEVSLDHGITWTNILKVRELTLIGFYTVKDSISSHANQPGFTGKFDWKQTTISAHDLRFYRFRFTFSSDGLDTKKNGWMLDDLGFKVLGTGINDITSKEEIGIYPNPSSDVVFLRSSESATKNVTVKDLMGQTILTTHEDFFNVSTLPVGVYLVEVMKQDFTYTFRFEKQ